jgi:hypothetical protein
VAAGFVLRLLSFLLRRSGFVYTKLTNKKIPCNTFIAKLVSLTEDEEHQMEIIAAAGAFVGLFTLWVVLPKKFLKK